MTREEQIKQIAKEYAKLMLGEEYQPYEGPYVDCITDVTYGAKWADENPKKGMASIDKVCEWLENECDINDYLGGIFSGPCSINFDWDKLSKNIRKALEE